MALTHADLAAQLVADGALAIAQGRQPAKMPVEAVVLDEKERERVGVKPGEMAVFYPVGDTGVFLQWDGPRASVWYEGVDCSGAIDALDRALKSSKAKKISDGAHTRVKGMKARQYRVDLDAKRFVRITANYPGDKKVRQEFVVQLLAQERK